MCVFRFEDKEFLCRFSIYHVIWAILAFSYFISQSPFLCNNLSKTFVTFSWRNFCAISKLIAYFAYNEYIFIFYLWKVDILTCFKKDFNIYLRKERNTSHSSLVPYLPLDNKIVHCYFFFVASDALLNTYLFGYIYRVRLKPPLKTSSKTTLHFYISSPQKYEQLHQSKCS